MQVVSFSKILVAWIVAFVAMVLKGCVGWLFFLVLFWFFFPRAITPITDLNFQCGAGCKCGFYRKKLLCPYSEFFLFTDLDGFNLEASHKFFFISSLCCWQLPSLCHGILGYQSFLSDFWLGHQYINYWIFILLIQWRNATVWDWQLLHCFLLPVKVRSNTL